jgi:hypothetical protein
MIGKVITGKFFRGCLAYCLSDRKIVQGREVEGLKKDRVHLLAFNQCGGGVKELATQFEEVRRLNPRQSKPVLHITLSMAPGERLGRRDLLTLVEACAKHMGFDQNQYVAVEHSDTKHQHLHIVANRVDFEGRVVSDSNSFKRIASCCRKMEKELGLQQVLSPKKFLPNELRDLPRNDARKKALREHLQTKLFQANNYDSFERAMKAFGYRVERGRGIAFIDEKGVRIKGSEVGFSLARIERILSQKQDRLLRKKQETAPTRLSALLPKRSDHSIARNLSFTKDLLDAMQTVQQDGDHIPPGLLKQKKKNKPKRPRL